MIQICATRTFGLSSTLVEFVRKTVAIVGDIALSDKVGRFV